MLFGGTWSVSQTGQKPGLLCQWEDSEANLEDRQVINKQTAQNDWLAGQDSALEEDSDKFPTKEEAADAEHRDGDGDGVEDDVAVMVMDGSSEFSQGLCEAAAVDTGSGMRDVTDVGTLSPITSTHSDGKNPTCSERNNINLSMSLPCVFIPEVRPV